MGVDAGIFAKNAKRYCWFDRISNVEKYWDLQDDETVMRLSDVKYSLMHEDNMLESEEILSFLRANAEAWEAGEESERYRAGWVRSAIAFVEAHPGDRFFIKDDHNGAYGLIGEMYGRKGGVWTGEYLEFKPKEAK